MTHVPTYNFLDIKPFSIAKYCKFVILLRVIGSNLAMVGDVCT